MASINENDEHEVEDDDDAPEQDEEPVDDEAQEDEPVEDDDDEAQEDEPEEVQDDSKEEPDNEPPLAEAPPPAQAPETPAPPQEEEEEEEEEEPKARFFTSPMMRCEACDEGKKRKCTCGRKKRRDRPSATFVPSEKKQKKTPVKARVSGVERVERDLQVTFKEKEVEKKEPEGPEIFYVDGQPFMRI